MTTTMSSSSTMRRLARRRATIGLVITLVAAALLLACAPFASADVQTQFTIVGHGWGHGIGMSQYGAYGYAQHGWGYRAILKHYYTGVGFGKVGDRSIRVMLNQGLSSVTVTSTSRFRAASGKSVVLIPSGSSAKLTWTGSVYRLTVGGSTWDFSGPVTLRPGSAKLNLRNANQNGYVGRYRGTLRVIHYTGGFTVVNRLLVEKYLYGVVPRESPSSWPIEALKAQACAARSYALRSLGKSGAYDVYCTAWSQVYGGFDGEAATTNTAVNKTAHVVPTYGGQPISAYFFSTSGGHTENVENVWGSSPVPYLKGVSDPYDTASPYHDWPENPKRKLASTLAGQLGAYSTTHSWGVKGSLRALYVVRRGVSPRVVKALVIGSNGVSEISGAHLRTELALRDTWVSFTSLSIDPSAGTHKTITYGQTTTVGGRRYPAIADGAKVTLKAHPSGGGWASRAIVTERDSATLSGSTVRWSQYSAKVEPTRTTEYYVVSGQGISPHTTISVRPAVTFTASTTTPAVGDVVTFTGDVKPATDGKTVWLQIKRGSDWDDLKSTTLAADGTCQFDWASVAGTTSLRLRVPAGDGRVQGFSPVVDVTAGDGSPVPPAPGAGGDPLPSPLPSLSPLVLSTPSPAVPPRVAF
jgi:stage II sporulation protein D